MAKSAKRKNERRLLLGLLGLVVVGTLITAFFFGETSPIIAEGTITLSPELTGQAKGMRTVYIIVRDPASPMPMPIGAMATTIGADATGQVMTFKLTKDNLSMMNPSAANPAKMTIKARLDIDGLGGMDTPGDIIGKAENLDWGSQGIAVVLDQLVPAQSEPKTP
jgi:hypothetical protein